MQTRRSAAIPSLSLVLPHPPLPRRSSIRSSHDSYASPRTPRSSCGISIPPLFRLDSTAPRTSTDSWNSSSYDGGEDEIEWEWQPGQTALLEKTLDALPAHLLTPFNGAVPPSNLLDKIAHGIAQAKGSLEWPHTVRATRVKLLELARARAKESNSRRSSDIPEDVLQPTTNVPPKRLYRQSSMDFMQNDKLKESGSIDRLSTRLQRADRIISDSAYHPYARQTSRSPSPSSLPTPRLPFSHGDDSIPPTIVINELKTRNSASSLSLSSNRAPRLRRSTTLISSLPTIQSGVATTSTTAPASAQAHPGLRVRRSDSFSSPSLNGLGHSLKRAPSFGASSSRSYDSSSSRMSVDGQKENAPQPPKRREELDVYPSSDEEERARGKKAKKPRTRCSSPAAPGTKALASKASSSSTSTAVAGTGSGTVSPAGSVRVKKPASRPARAAALFGAELPHPQRDPPAPAAIPAPAPAPMPVDAPAPHKTLRRVKTTTFPLRPARRISFGQLRAPVEESREGTGAGLGSAFQMD